MKKKVTSGVQRVMVINSQICAGKESHSDNLANYHRLLLKNPPSRAKQPLLLTTPFPLPALPPWYAHAQGRPRVRCTGSKLLYPHLPDNRSLSTSYFYFPEKLLHVLNAARHCGVGVIQYFKMIPKDSPHDIR